ncbi:hypothetical protein ACFQ5N_11135 [Lutibacter holmesii]|uniref:HEAT repeat domain-containing protein n=1 Tax=Lutibacter holmesii TaxID=1137985 RepID=A0ABW3WQR0_9FLAO
MFEYQNIIEYFKLLPILVKLIWVLSSVLFVILLGLIIYLKILRVHLNKNDIKQKQLQKKNEELLINYLYAGDDEFEISKDQQVIINEVKNEISDSFYRNNLISVMSKLVNDISGEMAVSIHTLFFKTGLINYSLEKLKEKKWEVIASGISELTQFEVKQAAPEIQKLIKHPNKEVRNQAQLYLVNLFQFKGLKFLDKLDYQLSEWNQIQLLEILQKFDNQDIIDISPWLNSTNISVVQFALKLSKVYNHLEAKESLLELLKHKNQDIRVQTITILCYFMDSECKPYLKANFENSSECEQIAFFKLLENVADESDEKFILKNIHHANFEIKHLALNILKSISLEQFDNVVFDNYDVDGAQIIKFINAI